MIPLVSPEKAHAVHFSGEGLLLTSNEQREITWLPEHLVPVEFTDIAITVDIRLYVQQYNIKEGDFEWKMHESILQDVPNDGQEMITIPRSRVSCNHHRRDIGISFQICPVAIRVSISKKSLSPIGIWSGIAFLESSSSNVKTLGNQCNRWTEAEASSFSSLRRLQSCPPTRLVANFDVELELEDRVSITNPDSKYAEQYMDYFHPGAEVCYRQNVYVSNSDVLLVS